MKIGEKRGQITLFIILAILIIGSLLFIFWPKIKISITGANRPITYIEKCVADKEFDNTIQLIAEQGGSAEPENYILFQDKKVEYLCYTNQYYKRCLVQKPLLKASMEQELAEALENKIIGCFDSLKKNLESAGYNVELDNISFQISLVPEKLIVDIDAPLRIEKGETEYFRKFRIEKQSHLYNLVMIGTTIIKNEAKFGDNEVVTYMIYYPDVKIQKLKQEDGSTIYILEDTETREHFIFASRSVAWPAGYGISQPYIKI